MKPNLQTPAPSKITLRGFVRWLGVLAVLAMVGAIVVLAAMPAEVLARLRAWALSWELAAVVAIVAMAGVLAQVSARALARVRGGSWALVRVPRSRSAPVWD